MKTKYLLLFYGLTLAQQSFSQGHTPTGNIPNTNTNDRAASAWYRGGNLGSGTAGINNIFGTRWQSDIFIMTNNRNIAQFTHGSILSTVTGDFGDGLRILPPAGNTGALDLFTTGNNGQNETHVRWGGSGQISGQNNRFEILSTAGQGLWFNLVNSAQFYKFATQSTVHGFVGNNRYWRIGDQSEGQNLQAQRRLEVADLNQQLRLTYANASSGPFTDFLSNNLGNLQIQPLGGNVGINLTSNPTANLDVNGNMRIRNVQSAVPNSLLIGVNATASNDVNVRRLDFSGNSNEVLLGNGTFGPVPVSPGINTALNGAWINFNGEIEWGTNPLVHPTTLPLGQNNLLFKTFANEIGVVTFGGNVLGGIGRVIINNDIYQNGLIVNSLSPITIPTKYGTATFANNANRLTAVLGNANTGNSVQGVYGIAQEGLFNTIGVRGYAVSTSNQSINIGGDFSAGGVNFTENIGARGYSDGSVKTNFGGKFKAGGSGSLSIGVYGECTPDNPATGLVGYAGYFAGITVETQGSLWPSDSTLKHNITPLDITSDSLMQLLTPVSYEYNHNGNAARLNLAEGTKFGFLAQQVEQYFPTAVKMVTHPAEYDSLGNEVAPSFQYKAVDMSQLIPVMMSDLQRKSTIIQNQTATINDLNNNIQTLEGQVDDLNNRLSQLENCLSGILPYLCQLSQSAVQANTPQSQETIRTQLQVKLTNREAIILNQNVPNPFAEQTVINFSIPETVQKAQIHFYNGTGQLMQSVDVTERGLGSLTVFGSDLSSGTYTYTLVADGMVVATKKMVKQ